jgi:hypothetical protein
MRTAVMSSRFGTPGGLAGRSPAGLMIELDQNVS